MLHFTTGQAKNSGLASRFMTGAVSFEETIVAVFVAQDAVFAAIEDVDGTDVKGTGAGEVGVGTSTVPAGTWLFPAYGSTNAGNESKHWSQVDLTSGSIVAYYSQGK